MRSRQTLPRRWLIIDAQPASEIWSAVSALRSGSGILVLRKLRPVEFRRLRHLASARRLTLAEESERSAARVHNVAELRLALLRRTPMILISPIHETGTHPDWTPLPRARAATLARLARRKAIALGGMNQERYAKIAPLGFIGWAGISAFRT